MGVIDQERIHSAASMRAGVDEDKRWVTAAFTWNGLQALGLDEESLASFPEEFKQGMAARAEMLGDTGVNAAAHWVGGLASPDLHAIVILFARDEAEHDRCVAEHAEAYRQLPRRRGALGPRSRRHSTVRIRARAFRLPRQAVGAGHRGNGSKPTPGTGEPLNPASSSLVIPTSTASRQTVRSLKFWRGTGAIWPTAGSRSMWGSFGVSSGARRDRRGAGTDRGQVDGALAQRRAARARTGKRRSRARRRRAAQQ